MPYGQYPFWLKNQADSASASASHARYEADNTEIGTGIGRETFQVYEKIG